MENNKKNLLKKKFILALQELNDAETNDENKLEKKHTK